MEYLDKRIDWDVAAWYDEIPLWSAPFGILMLENIPMSPGMRVLDVGCGTGFPVLELAQRLGRSCTVVGLDHWQDAMNRAREKAEALGISNVEIVDGDAATLPFEDSSFDLVVSSLGINNLENLDLALAECRRVLKDAGRIALTTNPYGHMSEFYDVYKATLEQIGESSCLGRLDCHIRHRRTIDEVGNILTSSGFSLRKVEKREFTMRFLDGSAMFRHSFIRLAFLDGWREIAGESEKEVFGLLETNLNKHAKEKQGLGLSIPTAYIEAIKIQYRD